MCKKKDNNKCKNTASRETNHTSPIPTHTHASSVIQDSTCDKKKLSPNEYVGIHKHQTKDKIQDEIKI